MIVEGLIQLRLEEAVEKIHYENFTSGLAKKRFACAHCGRTWVELVGLVGGLKDGKEDLYFQIGAESEVCQTCRFRLRACPKCGSKDAYEIKFALNSSDDVPLSFEGIRTISRG